MAHSQQHPMAGKRFRIRLALDAIEAMYDQSIHNMQFRLIDWADRIEFDITSSRREREVAVMFFAHRCYPDLPPIDPVPLDFMALDDVVYGRCVDDNENIEGDLMLLRESELVADKT